MLWWNFSYLLKKRENASKEGKEGNKNKQILLDFYMIFWCFYDQEIENLSRIYTGMAMQPESLSHLWNFFENFLFNIKTPIK